MGTAEHGALMARFRSGVKDYAYGGHPVWELFRTVYQMSSRPYIIGGLFLGAGYVWAMVRRAQRPISLEMVAFPQTRSDATIKEDSSRSIVKSLAETPLAKVREDDPGRQRGEFHFDSKLRRRSMTPRLLVSIRLAEYR